MKRVALLALLLAACGRGPAPTSPTTPVRASRPIAKEELAKCESEVGPLAALQPADDELREHVEGLVETLASNSPDLRRVARNELAGLGPSALSVLANELVDGAAPQARRVAAAQALGSLDSREAAEVLLKRIELARTQVDGDTWMRAHCAAQLGSGTQDWVVPRLLLHLRYEVDHETAIWMALTLAHFGNFAGLDALNVISSTAKTQELRDSAAATIAQLASDAGQADGASLYRAWNSGDAALPAAAFSRAHELEVWRIVAGFSEWQLRGVDDGRFVLQREHAGVAPLLARALEDGDRYVRMHSAQALERMGGRARAVGPQLLAALDDREIAPQVARSLGAIGFAAAENALAARLAPSHPLELRVAAAKALGRLGLSSSVEALEPWIDARESVDLRSAVACSRVECSPLDAPRAAIELVLGHFTSGEVESAEPEIALDRWLAALATARPEVAAPIFEGWRGTSPEDPRARVTQRAEFLRSRLDALFAGS